MNSRWSKKNNARRVRHHLLPAMVLWTLVAPGVYAQSAMPDMPGMDHGAMGAMHGRTAQPASPAADRSPHAGHAAGATGSTPSESAPSAPGQQPQSQTRRGAQAELPSVPYRRNPDGSYAIPGTGMAMADNDIFYLVLFEQLEYFNARDDHGLAWDGVAWVGRDYNKLWLKTEGERVSGRSEGRVEALWSRAVAAFWDLQFGVRNDFGPGPNRKWATVTVQGIAPYWFDIEGAAYLGSNGRTAARAKAEYSFRLSQVSFLTPEFEANLYGKADRERGIGSGLSDASLGLRWRYELRREIAPYIGINWSRKFGQTARFAQEAGERRSNRQIVAGLRVWF